MSRRSSREQGLLNEASDLLRVTRLALARDDWPRDGLILSEHVVIGLTDGHWRLSIAVRDGCLRLELGAVSAAGIPAKIARRIHRAFEEEMSEELDLEEEDILADEPLSLTMRSHDLPPIALAAPMMKAAEATLNQEVSSSHMQLQEFSWRDWFSKALIETSAVLSRTSPILMPDK
jgi:hypothetical protein